MKWIIAGSGKLINISNFDCIKISENTETIPASTIKRTLSHDLVAIKYMPVCDTEIIIFSSKEKEKTEKKLAELFLQIS